MATKSWPILSLHTSFFLQLQSNDSDVLLVSEGVAEAVGSGYAAVELMLPAGLGLVSSPTITVRDDEIPILELDPIVASLRLTAEAPASRVSSASTTLETLSTLFFFRETVTVTASAILVNGRRVVIRDADRLNVTSSNSTIVSVNGNQIIAEANGTVTLTVKWLSCNVEADIEVTVAFDTNRPVFDPNTQLALVPEDSLTGHVITRVVAVDPDSPDDSSRSDTQYRILSPDPYNGLFLVNQISGEVTLNGPLDYETRVRYELIIEATDRQQRLAEQEIQGGGPQVGSGSGDGSGEGTMLMPENITIDVEPPDRLSVSLLLKT